MPTMYRLLCFSVAVLSANSNSRLCHSRPHSSLSEAQFLSFDAAMERIIHGTVVDISEYPYQVALVWRRKRIICGGALVGPKTVLTAAHCTHVSGYERRAGLSVLVGANYLGDPEGVLHRIHSATKHPDFSSHDFDYDISVIRLRRAVEYGYRVHRIPIATGEHPGDTVATVSGWGRTEFGTPSRYLRATRLTIERWPKCQDYFPGVFHPEITDNMICVRPSRTTTYYGDSGGPLVVDGELVGLVSFGRTVKGKKKVTVFTKVKNFIDFLTDVVPHFNSE